MKKYQAGGIPRMARPPMGRVSDPAPRSVARPPVKFKSPQDPRLAPAMQAAQQARGGRRGMPMAPSAGARMAKGGKVKGKGGSSYRKAADGVASKGKTKAKMVKMAMGGKC